MDEPIRPRNDLEIANALIAEQTPLSAEEVGLGSLSEAEQFGRQLSASEKAIANLGKHELDGSVFVFMVAANQTVMKHNPRQAALYTGLQIEELAEKLEALGLTAWAADLQREAQEFKQGEYDSYFADPNLNLRELLDADIDLAWVSLGAAYSIGADTSEAIHQVAYSNLAKIHSDGFMHKDENGKVIKPEGWAPPDLSQCFPVPKSDLDRI